MFKICIMDDKIEKKFIRLIFNNKESRALKIIDQVENLDCTNENKESALQLSCSQNMIKLATLLIKKGANVNSRDQ